MGEEMREKPLDLLRIEREKRLVEKGFDICPFCYWIDKIEVKLEKVPGSPRVKKCPKCKMSFSTFYILPRAVRRLPRSLAEKRQKEYLSRKSS